MEKTWNDFWVTGKVEDYLTYRNRVADDEKKKRENEQRQESERERDTSWNSRVRGLLVGPPSTGWVNGRPDCSRRTRRIL